MTTIIFLAIVAATFFIVFAIESDSKTSLKVRRPTGLFTWITGGNWPVKIGGVLIVVGVGALLRFALINIEVPIQLKLGMGFIIAFTLGLASIFIPSDRAKRPLSLALGGAGFGVAYLTAYGAFGVFEYLSNPVGLALLLLTSVAAAVYSITRSALSLALLSMVGAFLAPAFAVKAAGPEIVYGYYIAAGFLTFIMVGLRGWRPLIHLSFLFTLVGGVFFAWTKQFNSPQYSEIMLPVLLVLTALHVAMPIIENRQKHTDWMKRLDIVYLLALPLVVALSALNIAPNRDVLSNELLGLAAIWFFSAIVLRVGRQGGGEAHSLIALLFVVTGFAARFENLPWELFLLTISMFLLALVAWKRPIVSRLHNILAGLVLLLGAIHILSLAAVTNIPESLIGSVFVERLSGAFLLICAGIVCRKIRQTLDTLLLAVGIVWAVLVLGAEIIRLDLATLAIVVHWTLILMLVGLWIPGRRIRVIDRNVTLLAMAILTTAAWSTTGILTTFVAWFTMVGGTLALIAASIRPVCSEDQAVGPRFIAVLVAPAVAALWAFKVGDNSSINSYQLGCFLAVFVAMTALISGRFVGTVRAQWLPNATDIFSVVFVLLLVISTLVNIERTLWAVSLELLCFVSLIGVVWLRRCQHRSVDFIMTSCFVSLGLILQTNILRMYGPEGRLDITDILTMDLPSIISLLWVLLGAGLTIWSVKIYSKLIWSAGAALLVAAAIKLIVIDFGSLGQLTNILAVIAAGVTFLLVGWLAPMPPKEDSIVIEADLSQSQKSESISYDNTEVSYGASSWVLAAVIFTAVGLFQFSQSTQIVIRDLIVKPMSINHEPAKIRRSKTIDNTLGTKLKQLQKTVLKGSSENEEHGSKEKKTALSEVERIVQTNLYTEIRTTPTVSQDIKERVIQQQTEKPYTVTIGANGVPIYKQTKASVIANLSRSIQKNSIIIASTNGKQGLDRLVREGRMRRATAQDVRAWLKATGRTEQESSNLLTPDPYSSGQYILQTFVVIGEMVVPSGLTGANSATFIVPQHVQRPYGDLGHSRILEMP